MSTSPGNPREEAGWCQDPRLGQCSGTTPEEVAVRVGSEVVRLLEGDAACFDVHADALV